MGKDDIRIYDACDRAIREMNRENLKEFGKLKLAKFDQLNIVREITKVYHTSAKQAKKRYYEVAFEAYLLAMALCDENPKKAHQKAEKAITDEWIEEILEQVDPVTLFRFNSETDRKAYRLVEAVSATTDRDAEIDKALRIWSRQLGQYAINFTDYAVVEAYKDAGAKMAEWETAKDENVCPECHALDGQVFRITELPRKPHWGCRCRWRAVFRKGDGAEVEKAEA